MLDAADGDVVGRGLPRLRRRPARRDRRAGRRPASGPAAAPPWSPWSPATTPAAPARARQALIRAGVARVVVGVPDPNPVAAGGAETLRAAGVEVEIGVRAAEAAGRQPRLADRECGPRGPRPYVIWKFAATLDGRSAAADGTSQWITSAEARADVHALRGTVDAIIAGVGTVLADDPHLTVRDLRDGALAIRQPLRVVVDSAGRTPADARVRDGAARTWIATAAEVGAGAGRPGRPAQLLAACTTAACRRCCWRAARRWPGRSCAPGWSTRSSATSRRSCSAPARPPWPRPASCTIAEAIDLELTDVTQVGPDLRITALPERER